MADAVRGQKAALRNDPDYARASEGIRELTLGTGTVIKLLLAAENLGSNGGLLLAADVTGFAMGPAISAVLVPAFGIPAPTGWSDEHDAGDPEGLPIHPGGG